MIKKIIHNKNLEQTSCWIITEGMAGTENQCIGIAEALNIAPIIKHVKLRFPWKQLTPYLRIGQKWAFSNEGDSFSAPWPDLVLASGRKSIPAALYIKQASKNKTLVVQVQDPRISPNLFDIVVVPQHDPARGDNVVNTIGSLHRVTVEKLTSEAEKFQNLQQLPAPRIAVLIGGNSKAHTITIERTEEIAEQLKAFAEKYSIMITVSRRTPTDCLKVLQEKLSNLPNIFLWNGEGDNPYFAMLGLADIVFVTEDSVSMTSEAISTGKPVYTIALDGGALRINKFHQLLHEQGYTRRLNKNMELKQWQYTPPHDTLMVANRIIDLLKERGQI